MRETPVATRGTARMRVRAEVLAWVLGLGALVGGCLALVVAPTDAPRFEARLDWPHPAPVGWPREPRGGEFAEPVRYEVDRVRNGRSFTTRRVVARQSAGAILTLECSFQRFEEGVESQPLAMPTGVPSPETLPQVYDAGLDRREVAVPAPRSLIWGRFPIDRKSTRLNSSHRT